MAGYWPAAAFVDPRKHGLERGLRLGLVVVAALEAVATLLIGLFAHEEVAFFRARLRPAV